MASGRRYDAVFFDLYGTLVDVRTDEDAPAAWRTLRLALAAHGVDYTTERALYTRFESLAAPLRLAAVRSRGRWAEPDLLPAFAGLLRADADADGDAIGVAGAAGADVAAGIPGAAADLAWTFRRASTSLLRTYPGATDLLASLHAAGLRTVLVSNAQSCYTRPELTLLGLDRALDRIVISSEEGIRKPSPDFFRIALEREGLDPSRVLMVGNDERCDIIGARSAGIDGAYLRTAISPADDPAASDTAVASFDGADYDGLLEHIMR